MARAFTAHFPTRRPIRASRLREPDDIIAARAQALRPFLGSDPGGRLASLQRMLREERRAARAGIGYDAARHAALRRLLDEAQQTPT